jgi:succinyl-CoA synthetase beta subunit
MKIHEYQAKEFFRRVQIPVPNGKAAFAVAEAETIRKELIGPWVVKAQIHAGGRGKGGGVAVTKTPEDFRKTVDRIFGMTLVTPQTAPEGRVVKRLLIEEGASIVSEYYLAVTLDRSTAKLTVITSPAGGMDIEEVARTEPRKIFKVWIDPAVSLRDFQCRELSAKMGFRNVTANKFADIVKKLVKLYLDSDAVLIEINPLVLTGSGRLLALDAKINLDDNAVFRHPGYSEFVDPDEEDPAEAEAKKHDLSYVSLAGNIGCMVNGAGLAMATMDIIKYEGGESANFLDVGGGASESKVKEAFKIILRDESVRAIMVNIFGGIMKCDVIAAGIVVAARELKPSVPIVVRLEGTNVEQGKRILKDSGLAIIATTGMKDAAQKAVAAARGDL